jgi:hypothetical protein
MYEFKTESVIPAAPKIPGNYHIIITEMYSLGSESVDSSIK